MRILGGGFRVCADGQPVNIEPGRVSAGSRVVPNSDRMTGEVSGSKGRVIACNARIQRKQLVSLFFMGNEHELVNKGCEERKLPKLNELNPQKNYS